MLKPRAVIFLDFPLIIRITTFAQIERRKGDYCKILLLVGYDIPLAYTAIMNKKFLNGCWKALTRYFRGDWMTEINVVDLTARKSLVWVLSGRKSQK